MSLCFAAFVITDAGITSDGRNFNVSGLMGIFN